VNRIVNVGLKFPNARQVRTATQGIVLHHLDAQWSVQQVHKAHIRKGWNGIGYNFHVAKNGVISLGRGMEFVGSHTKPPAGINSSMIGIGCEGQYHSVDKVMPRAQFDAIIWLVRHLRGIYGDIPIKGHRDLAATACPGRYFPLEEIKRAVENNRESEVEEMRFNNYGEIDTFFGKEKDDFGRTVADWIFHGVARGVIRRTNGSLNLTESMIVSYVWERREEARNNQ